MFPMISLWLLTSINIVFTNGHQRNENGFVVYCPCMGRFGNQMEHLIGAIAFAQALNRTLVLPPFVEYHPSRPNAVMVEFDKYFQIEPLKKVLKVILMRDFMNDIAPRVWPLNQRFVFCYHARQSIFDKNKAPSCCAQEGNPFGPFWAHSRITFVGDIYYGTLITETHNNAHIDSPIGDAWNKNFPVEKFPVLAFVQAPVAFPASEDNHWLHEHLQWSQTLTTKAEHFIEQFLKEPFIGIHLRNNIDWVRVCDLIDDETKELFASAQCTLGYKKLTVQKCLQTADIIVINQVQLIGAKSLFVSSDHNHHIAELTRALTPMGVVVQRLEPDDLHISLVILSRANHFIGNCVSTLSSFIHRQRKYSPFAKKDTSFFAENDDIHLKSDL